MVDNYDDMKAKACVLPLSDSDEYVPLGELFSFYKTAVDRRDDRCVVH